MGGEGVGAAEIVLSSEISKGIESLQQTLIF